MKPRPFDVVKGGYSPSPIIKSAVLGTASQCKHPDHRQFALDMASVGIPTKTSNQKLYWNGPIVYAKDIVKIMHQIQVYSRVTCIWDESDEGAIIYPCVYNKDSLRKVLDNLNFVEIMTTRYLREKDPLRAIAKNVLEQIQEARH